MHLSCQPLTLAHKILIAIAMCCSWAKQLIQDQASQGYSKFEQHVATCRWFISKGKNLGFSLKIRASWQDSNNALVKKNGFTSHHHHHWCHDRFCLVAWTFGFIGYRRLLRCTWCWARSWYVCRNLKWHQTDQDAVSASFISHMHVYMQSQVTETL